MTLYVLKTELSGTGTNLSPYHARRIFNDNGGQVATLLKGVDQRKWALHPGDPREEGFGQLLALANTLDRPTRFLKDWFAAFATVGTVKHVNSRRQVPAYRP